MIYHITIIISYIDIGLSTQVKLFFVRVQTETDKETETKPKNISVIEKCIEPEKLFSDSFITEDTDGRKVNVTRKISSRKMKRITYSDLVIFIVEEN
jgi:hypothetical protein